MTIAKSIKKETAQDKEASQDPIKKIASLHSGEDGPNTEASDQQVPEDSPSSLMPTGKPDSGSD